MVWMGRIQTLPPLDIVPGFMRPENSAIAPPRRFPQNPRLWQVAAGNIRFI
jgi:hypothetical protein